VPDAAEPIIARDLFEAAQRRMPRRNDRTDEELLADLRSVLAETGRLSHILIARDPRLASPRTYAARFGGLGGAYARVGYMPTGVQAHLTQRIACFRHPRRPSPSRLTDTEVVERLVALRLRVGVLTQELIEITPGLPRVRELRRRFGTIPHAYALAGHVPTPRQETSMARRRGRPKQS
jgi:hypothetical protein